MPRRSLSNDGESPVPRRTSARIAAVQAASPAKSPAKSPRRKRQPVDTTKNASEDTESQQSQLKSESSVEELNGLETGSSVKDQESVSDSQEIPPKKSKVHEETTMSGKPKDTVDSAPIAESLAAPDTKIADVHVTPEVAEPTADAHETSEAPIDFEVVEKNEVPASDSAEVEAAISVQGDGQLLVGFVQVDKDELPAAASVEVQQKPITEEPSSAMSDLATEEAPTAPASSVNGVGHVSITDNVTPTVPETTTEVQTKVHSISEVPVEPSHVPAAGDTSINMVSVEPIPQ